MMLLSLLQCNFCLIQYEEESGREWRFYLTFAICPYGNNNWVLLAKLWSPLRSDEMLIQTQIFRCPVSFGFEQVHLLIVEVFGFLHCWEECWGCQLYQNGLALPEDSSRLHLLFHRTPWHILILDGYAVDHVTSSLLSLLLSTQLPMTYSPSILSPRKPRPQPS